jgi:hypothetical protein
MIFDMNEYNKHKFPLKRTSNISLNRPVNRGEKNYKKPDFTAQGRKKVRKKTRKKERKKFPTNLPIS